MYVNEYFFLRDEYVDLLADLEPEFGYDGFGEIVFYRTYSRTKENGGQENWLDVVLRVINGTMSIRKDWYVRNYINWDEEYWQEFAYKMALYLFKMYWMPAGRGLWAMGTKFVFERGSMALNNCGSVKLGSNDTLANDLHWMMDALMLGVGVGFEPVRDDLKIYKPIGEFIHFIGDSREDWCDSLRLLINAYTQPKLKKPRFKFDYIRAKGLPIKGFGGLASGPAPLKFLFQEIEKLFETPKIDIVRLKTDIANQIGICVVAGNVRRSAELAKGLISDPVFLELKDYEINPEREDWGWMSNNTVQLYEDSDFEMLGEVAKRVIQRGEPGIMNLRNFQYGRIGKHDKNLKEDKATLLNPCAEIPLENYELCNVVETLPTQCPNIDVWYEACKFATFYASTVSLLPTHREETNKVVLRNRRIGVSIIDWTGWVLRDGLHKVTAYMRQGYRIVTETNQWANSEAGVPEAIRKTTVKPGGTVPKLPGKTPAIGYPTFRETLRRIRVASNSPICPILDEANIPWEPDFWDEYGTRIYEYPTRQGPAPPADEVSLWEQAFNLVTVQREWADNAVSNTLYFKPKWKLVCMRDTAHPKLSKEEVYTKEFPKLLREHLGNFQFENDFVEFGKVFIEIPQKFKILTKLNKYDNWELYVYEFDPNHEENVIEKVLAAIAPLIKSCSLLPHSAKGAYRQMPEQGISVEEYEQRLAIIKKIDWSKFCNSDGMDERYCTGDTCVIENRTDS